MTKLPLVHVILLSWNNWRDTLQCLQSLEAMDYPNWQAVIVDNGSKDDSVARLRAAYPNVPVIENGKNLGFAAGCNVGARYALEHEARYVWLLNSDTTAAPSALTEMVRRAEQDPGLGAVGSVIYFMDDPTRVQAWGGGHINFWLGRSRLDTKQVVDAALDFISGASILIRRQALQNVGLLDEGFFMFWEESDYCFRLRAAGWRLATATGSAIYHKGSATFVGRNHVLDAYFTESARRFFDKHAKFPAFSLWTGVWLSMMKRILSGNWKSAIAVWPGHLKNLEERDAPGA